MHPMIERPVRLVAYLGVAAMFGVLLALLVQTLAPGSLRGALALCLPLALVYGFQCLSVWYPVRQLPSSRAGAPQLVLLLTLASFASAAIWTAAGHLWAAALAGSAGFADLPARFAIVLPLFFVLGVFLFVLATLVHFLFVVVERSRAAERRGLEREVHAREAELKSLKAQLDPHFLFNSLNSVSALIGSDPPAARRMCYLMAGFFRKSLGLGQKEQIALGEEIYLAETYLAIEEVRFGARLRSRFRVAEATLAFAVPPLVLQPLIENAVHHGIAHLVEGGEVTIAAERQGEHLELVVENPCDPDRPASRGAGVGLANVRARIEALYGHRARVDVAALPESYRVRILLPIVPAA
jgi:two-component system, LytTR family, sensor histidine kinase AlgZ